MRSPSIGVAGCETDQDKGLPDSRWGAPKSGADPLKWQPYVYPAAFRRTDLGVAGRPVIGLQFLNWTFEHDESPGIVGVTAYPGAGGQGISCTFDTAEYDMSGVYKLFRLNADGSETPIATTPPLPLPGSTLTIPLIAIDESDLKFLILRPQ
jgi:hypothetical protein